MPLRDSSDPTYEQNRFKLPVNYHFSVKFSKTYIKILTVKSLENSQ